MATIILSGFSGAGKDSIAKSLLDLSDRYTFSVSATTRRKREGEVDGKNYYFLTEEEFAKKEANGEFLETTVYNGIRYGTLKSEIIRANEAGQDLIMVLDCPGALHVKAIWPSAITVFVAVPKIAGLKNRLRKRGETKEKIQERFALTREEALFIPKFDYLVLNEPYKLNKAVQKVHSIATVAELATEKQLDIVQDLLGQIKEGEKENEQS